MNDWAAAWLVIAVYCKGLMDGDPRDCARTWKENLLDVALCLAWPVVIPAVLLMGERRLRAFFDWIWPPSS